jgi:NADH:ubiquinone oxidoreductase subunit 6 (subunit J)
MAATVIIYAGAIIVTFLFLLMLSHTGGPSDENDRSREPLLGSLAGFAFAGLVLFALYTSADEPVPAPPLTADDRRALAAAADELAKAQDAPTVAAVEAAVRAARGHIGEVVGFAPADPTALDRPARRPTAQDRLRGAQTDARTWQVIEQADRLRDKAKAVGDRLENLRFEKDPDPARAKALAKELRDEVALMAGRGELPARNVSAVGYALYSEHLIAVEMAGTLLLVATIGAVAIAGRKGAPA